LHFASDECDEDKNYYAQLDRPPQCPPLIILFGDCKSFDTKLVWCHGHKIIPTPCKD
jgi:hypothetical protein